MKVVILCGGQGTRLREETEYRPKPLVQIGGQPILLHIMKIYASYGFKEFVLCLGHKGEMIKEYFLNYKSMANDFTLSLSEPDKISYHNYRSHEDFTVTLADTGIDSMTGARIKKIERYIDTDEFMVTYGDGLSDLNISKLLTFHRQHGRIGTVTAVRPFSRFGILDIAKSGEITSFSEKPQVEGWVSAGFFVFKKSFFEYLDTNPECVLEKKPLDQLARDAQLIAYQHNGFFYAMDSYREYLHLNQLWASDNAPWRK